MSDGTDRERLIEIGLLLVDRVDEDRLARILQARAGALEALRAEFPSFEWRMPVMQRAVTTPTDRVEPTVLLDEGVHERNGRHWDFAIVITQIDLASHYRPYAIATPSRAVSVGVLSTARLGVPLVDEDGEPSPDADATIAGRVLALSIHVLCDLNGVSHCDHPDHFTFAPRTPGDLDEMSALCETRRDQLAQELADVADLRLEEAPEAARTGMLAFYVRSSWINFDDIVSAVLRARPWEFPIRLGRVTAAALSALVILMLTAEVWELGARQPLELVAPLAFAALIGASAFALARHRLLVLRGEGARTEQIVTTNIAMTLVVLLGMLTTYAVVCVAALVLSALLFDTELVRRWTADGASGSRLQFASFVASAGILIGALGSTFEGLYFRHVAFVDEET